MSNITTFMQRFENFDTNTHNGGQNKQQHVTNIKQRHERFTISTCINRLLSTRSSTPFFSAFILLILTGFPKSGRLSSEAFASPLVFSQNARSPSPRLYTQRSHCNREDIKSPSFLSVLLRGGSLSNQSSNQKIQKRRTSTSHNVLKQHHGDDDAIPASIEANGRTDPSFGIINNRFAKDKNGSRNKRKSEDGDDHYRCAYVNECNLPTDIGHFRLRAYRVLADDVDGFREQNEHHGTEPCVIYSTEKPPFDKNGKIKKSVNVRIHDQCFTSEVFRSQRCDCKEQLKMSLSYIQKNGGMIIYLQQEGRGIGLANKVAAYALQDVGMDTVDANLHLGFPEDSRQYGVVPSILNDLNIASIQLITNNPRKVERLNALGINIEGTIPMVVQKANQHNIKYLQTKQDRMNHKNFGSMLASNLESLKDENIFSVDETIRKIMIPTVIESDMGIVKSSIADKYVNDGEEMAAAAITSALYVDDRDIGVTANEDGYCFGRESVEKAIDAVGKGEIVVVVDDMNRENEGDFIMAAEKATPETMATIVRYSSGVICVGMEGKRMDELGLPAMTTTNEDPKGTAFSVTVDATEKHGITTGISAYDRAKTIKLLSKASSTAKDFVRPGHIFPLRAKEGGVLARDGHTEAAVDLSKLAGCDPSGVLCEIVSEDNPVEMARLPELIRFSQKHGFVLTSIVDIAQYRRDTEGTSS